MNSCWTLNACPPHKQKAYKEWNRYSLPITETIHHEVLSLPISPVMQEEDMEEVVSRIHAFDPLYSSDSGASVS